ncbi:MAG: anaerobic ribonucleoside-triphosphate reductase [Thomasclavelia sp.]|nr:anaerobic ribonucleoside-triphosphate reductase [Thomasclavelia sp.]
MIEYIRKRDGRLVPFEVDKIAGAVYKAFQAVNKEYELKDALEVSDVVVQRLEDKDSALPTVELVQDTVEEVLLEKGYIRVAKEYILYRANRTRARQMKSRLMTTLEEITFPESNIEDELDYNKSAPMGTMYKYGSAAATQFNEMFVLSPMQAKYHKDGDIHIGDLDYLSLTGKTCLLDLEKLFEGGFKTGYGNLREPKSIRTYVSLACIAVQSNQNNLSGDQTIVNFDSVMAKGVKKTYIKIFKHIVKDAMYYTNNKSKISFDDIDITLSNATKLKEVLVQNGFDDNTANHILETSKDGIEKETYQAMEAFIHNMNTMNSHAGAKVPYSSITYGLDQSIEGRLVSRCLLLVTKEGIGNNQAPIFPKQCFIVKEGVNLKESDKNFDILKQALDVAKTRNSISFGLNNNTFNNVDNLNYSGLNTRVQEDIYGRENELSRGNLFVTTINLVSLALRSSGDVKKYFVLLDEMLEFTCNQLKERFQILGRRHVYNFPFLVKQGVWQASKDLKDEDTIEDAIKNGTISVGFVGLEQALNLLVGESQETDKGQELGVRIISHMKDYLDKRTQDDKLNYNVMMVSSSKISKEFEKDDKERYGEVVGITDQPYSLNVEVSKELTPTKLIEINAKYQPLTLGGHILNIPLSGSENLYDILNEAYANNLGQIHFSIK